MKFFFVFLAVFSCFSLFSLADIVDQKQEDTVVFCVNKEGVYLICSDDFDKCNSFYGNRCKMINIYSLLKIEKKEDGVTGDDSDFYDPSLEYNFKSKRPIYVGVDQEGGSVNVVAENVFGVLPGSVIRVFKGSELVGIADSPEASFVLSEGLYDVRVERPGYAPARKEVVVSSEESKNFVFSQSGDEKVSESDKVFSDSIVSVSYGSDYSSLPDSSKGVKALTGGVVVSESLADNKDFDIISVFVYSLMVLSFVSLIFIFVSKLRN
jgi:hypothetical protein